MPVSDPAIDAQLASKFAHLAPEDWQLRRVSEASAQYDVQLASGSGGDSIIVSGAVLLDGRFESQLSPLRFSPSVIAREREKFGPVRPEYPLVKGFEAVIDSDSLGFDTNRGIHRRGIKYFNRDQGVFCRGYNPGRLRCLWGSPDVRLVFHIHSDHTVAALEYIEQNVFQD